MTIDEMIVVLQAAKAGKQIQVKTHVATDWRDINFGGPLWSFHTQDYRVKPEPREWIAYVAHNGTLQQSAWYPHPLKAEQIRVREVL